MAHPNKPKETDSYPVKGADYTYKPKFLARAEGGSIESGNDPDFDRLKDELAWQREVDTRNDPTTNAGQGPTPNNLRNKQWLDANPEPKKKD